MSSLRKNLTILSILLLSIFFLSFLLISHNFAFAENEVRITYKSGDFIVDEDIVEFKTLDEDYSIKDSTYIRFGYKQTGWSINSDGSSLDYSFKSLYTSNDNLVLYPTWEKYNLSFKEEIYYLDMSKDEFVQLEFETNISKVDVQFICSDLDIAYVEEAKVYAKKTGEVEITLIENNTQTIAKTKIVISDFLLSQGELKKIVVDENKEYFYTASDTTTVDEVVDALKIYLNIENEYKVINENISTTTTLDQLSDDLKIHLAYSVKIKEGLITFDLSKKSAFLGEVVSLNNIEVPDDVTMGKLQVIAKDGKDVQLSQTNKTFIMPSCDVDVLINVKDFIIKTNIDKIEISGNYMGQNPTFAMHKVNKDQVNGFVIPTNKEVVCYYKIDSNLKNMQNDVTIAFSIPKELQGKDGIIIGMMKDGVYVESAIYISGNTMSFTTKNCSDFVILCKKHEGIKDLTGLIIAFSFLNCFAFVGIIILTMKYIDNRQNPQRYKKKTYSSILPLMFLVSAARTTQIVGVVLLSFLLLVQIIVLIILIVKLTEEGGILTTSKDYKRIK